MSHPRHAVIDVGTNSVKLLVAEVRGRTVRPLTESSEQTRLGQGFFQSRRLSAVAIARTARAVGAFAAAAREWGAVSIRVVATSAAREAANLPDLTQAIHRRARLRVEVLSGDQEADWAFAGVAGDPRFEGRPMLVLDVGGGSTEFILGDHGVPTFRESHPLGSVRLLEDWAPGDPPTVEALADRLDQLRSVLTEQLASRLRPALAALTRSPYQAPGRGGPVTRPASRRPKVQLVGTGGSASVLASVHLGLRAFDRDRIERARLSRTRVRTLLERFWRLPHADRTRIRGLPPERADVILTGTAIYLAVIEVFGFWEMRVSTRGLRFAALAAAGR